VYELHVLALDITGVLEALPESGDVCCKGSWRPAAEIANRRHRCLLRARLERPRSLDHLVGAGEQRWRHVEAERAGGRQIDDKDELVA
jgi:hypothetical protein